VNAAQKQFVLEAAAAAKASGHVFYQMAACEAASNPVQVHRR
jgi:hypothetical protein